jgi:hypothetical protein
MVLPANKLTIKVSSSFCSGNAPRTEKFSRIVIGVRPIYYCRIESKRLFNVKTIHILSQMYLFAAILSLYLKLTCTYMGRTEIRMCGERALTRADLRISWSFSVEDTECCNQMFISLGDGGLLAIDGSLKLSAKTYLFELGC